MDRFKWLARLRTLKLPLLVLLLGLGLMLLPDGSGKGAGEIPPEEKLERVLTQCRGVGECRVLVSEKGVVVACEGAEDPKVQLQILRAITSYTGFASDKITVLKMVEQS